MNITAVKIFHNYFILKTVILIRDLMEEVWFVLDEVSCHFGIIEGVQDFIWVLLIPSLLPYPCRFTGSIDQVGRVSAKPSRSFLREFGGTERCRRRPPTSPAAPLSRRSLTYVISRTVDLFLRKYFLKIVFCARLVRFWKN